MAITALLFCSINKTIAMSAMSGKIIWSFIYLTKRSLWSIMQSDFGDFSNGITFLGTPRIVITHNSSITKQLLCQINHHTRLIICTTFFRTLSWMILMASNWDSWQHRFKMGTYLGQVRCIYNAIATFLLWSTTSDWLNRWNFNYSKRGNVWSDVQSDVSLFFDVQGE